MNFSSHDVHGTTTQNMTLSRTRNNNAILRAVFNIMDGYSGTRIFDTSRGAGTHDVKQKTTFLLLHPGIEPSSYNDVLYMYISVYVCAALQVSTVLSLSIARDMIIYH